MAKALYQEAIMSTSGDRRKDPKKEGDITGGVNHQFCLLFVSSSKPKLISFTIRLSFSAAAVQLPSKRARINKANKWMKHFGRNIPQIFATKYIWCMVALSNRRAARAKQLTFFIALEESLEMRQSNKLQTARKRGDGKCRGAWLVLL